MTVCVEDSCEGETTTDTSGASVHCSNSAHTLPPEVNANIYRPRQLDHDNQPQRQVGESGTR